MFYSALPMKTLMQALVYAHEREHCVFMLPPLHMQCLSLSLCLIIFICFVWPMGFVPLCMQPQLVAASCSYILYSAQHGLHPLQLYSACGVSFFFFACHRLANYTYSKWLSPATCTGGVFSIIISHFISAYCNLHCTSKAYMHLTVNCKLFTGQVHN